MQGARGSIQLLATGGTISAGPDGPLRAKNMIKMARRLPEGIPVRGEDFATIHSSSISVEQIEALAARVRTALDDESCLGAVITHGTDTMEETAVALECMLHPQKPVVLTGAMVPTKDRGADGPDNVADAIAYVCDGSIGKLGVVIAMHQRLHAALEVSKGHTISTDSFTSGDAGPVGWVTPESVEIVRTPTRVPLMSAKLDETVALVRLTAGDRGRLIELAVEDGARGVVVECMGFGNVPGPVTEVCRRAAEAGVVVLTTTRVPAGPMGIWPTAIEAGMIPAAIGPRRLSGLAARMLLMAALGAGMDAEGISDLLNGTSPGKIRPMEGV
ncbi:MAG: asparaginase [Phycisphaerales bacterium]|nr:asparaginase [Phycisphaerales bacterium]MCB9835256.1 asparaginase [Phycisphaera sp.]